MFDWQAELSHPVPLPTAVRAATPPPAAEPPVSFAQALIGTDKTTSNENLPRPLIRGEQVSVKITQEVYEKGTAVCKHNLRGRLILNKLCKKGYSDEATENLENDRKLEHDVVR